MKELNEFYCINPTCPDYGQRARGNIRVHQQYGRYDPIRLLECKTCSKRFSERSHTALSECHLPFNKAVDILKHLA